MADTSNLGTNQAQSAGRKLRKIKKPKSHNGPINNTSSDVQPLKASYVRQAMPSTPQNNLVKAEPQDKAFATTEYNNAIPDNYVNNDYQETDEDFVYQGNYAYAPNMDIKKVVAIAIGCLLFGLLLGKFMFSSEQVVRDGLQGVVVNPEVPKGRTRCGVAEKTQGCVLYVMNPQRQELNGRDFYDLASQLTGRQRFVIETGNMRYSSMKVKPGNIAQLNIPPLQ